MTASNSTQLPAPARYFPLDRGIYEVAPGLRALGPPLQNAFGNGVADTLAFQLDHDFARYRANTLACRSERLEKYYGTADYPPEVSRAVNEFIAKKLTSEHPNLFQLQPATSGKARSSNGSAALASLHCKLTGEVLTFDSDFQLAPAQPQSNFPLAPPYASALDALASQVQEDIAVTVRRGGRDWLAAIHLCSPSHWAAEDKLGKSFFDIHAPVPGIDKINRAAASFVDAMIHKGPYVRFVWGFGSDTRLNHHPVPAPGHDPAEWKGRSFDPNRKGSPFILRVERQTLHGLPEVEASVFTIRVSFIDGQEIRKNPHERHLLKSALLSMSPESRRYKGLDTCMDALVSWLDRSLG